MKTKFNETIIGEKLNFFGNRHEKELKEVSKTSSDLLTEIYRAIALGTIGATNSKDYLNTLKRNDSNKELINRCIKVNELKITKAVIPTSIVITDYDMFCLCNEYNLRIAPLNKYSGYIPDDVISHIVNVQNNTDNMDFNKNILEIKSLNYYAGMERMECFEPFRGAVNMTRTYRYDGNLLSDKEENNVKKKNIKFSPYIDDKYKRDILKELISLEENDFNSGSLFIAAPYDEVEFDDINVVQEQKSRKTSDPIIFKYSDLGIVILAKWGEVENDRMFLPLNR